MLKIVKKLCTAALIASMLILPVSSVSPAGMGEPSPVCPAGDAPAQAAAAESMLPAVHGSLLAMLHHDASAFSPEDGALAWEGLYNMLALYGALDSLCDERSGELSLPEETVWDYAAALGIRLEELPPLPADMADRIGYDNVSHCYVLICGDQGPARLLADSVQAENGVLLLTGSFFDPAEDEVLARFQAELRPQDSMFGYVLSGLTVL